jgi:hypothetical protein
MRATSRDAAGASGLSRRAAVHNGGMDAGVKALAVDLQRIFGARLQSVVAYGDGAAGDGVHTLALVERLAFSDLAACAPRMADWRRAGAAAPLILTRDEFLRTLDVFPLEYGGIIANHRLVAGQDLLAGLQVSESDLRRGCELQAKSHLIHLREGFLESHGETTRIARVIAASAAPLRALLTHISRLPDQGTGQAASFTPTDASLAKLAQLRMGVPETLIREVLASSSDGQSTISDPSHLFGRYIDASRKIWEYVDRWRS